MRTSRFRRSPRTICATQRRVWAVSAGANVKAVQRMLGHAKASMTLDIYADLFDTDLDEVAHRLDAAIKSAA
jgi:integrase